MGPGYGADVGALPFAAGGLRRVRGRCAPLRSGGASPRSRPVRSPSQKGDFAACAAGALPFAVTRLCRVCGVFRSLRSLFWPTSAAVGGSAPPSAASHRSVLRGYTKAAPWGRATGRRWERSPAQSRRSRPVRTASQWGASPRSRSLRSARSGRTLPLACAPLRGGRASPCSRPLSPPPSATWGRRCAARSLGSGVEPAGRGRGVAVVRRLAGAAAAASRRVSGWRLELLPSGRCGERVGERRGAGWRGCWPGECSLGG